MHNELPEKVIIHKPVFVKDAGYKPLCSLNFGTVVIYGVLYYIMFKVGKGIIDELTGKKSKEVQRLNKQIEKLEKKLKKTES